MVGEQETLSGDVPNLIREPWIFQRECTILGTGGVQRHGIITRVHITTLPRAHDTTLVRGGREFCKGVNRKLARVYRIVLMARIIIWLPVVQSAISFTLI